MSTFTRLFLFWLGLVAPALRPWLAVALGAVLVYWLVTLTP